MAIFADEKAELWALFEDVRETVERQLGLHLKTRATRVAPVSEGVLWLGMRVFPGLVRLDHHGKMRFLRKLRASVRTARGAEVVPAREIARATSLCGHVAHADTLTLRQTMLDALDRALARE